MVDRDVEDRIVAGRQDLSKLANPMIPLVRTPEVVSPDEPSLEKILAKVLGFRLVDRCRAWRGHDHQRAPEQLVASQVDEEGPRLPRPVEAHVYLRQLGQ